MEIEVEAGVGVGEVSSRLRELIARKGQWEVQEQSELGGLVAKRAEEVLSLMEAGLDKEELKEALAVALDALDNMVSLPMSEDWRETLLAKYPRALEALRERDSSVESKRIGV